jgi:hypothetical protein
MQTEISFYSAEISPYSARENLNQANKLSRTYATLIEAARANRRSHRDARPPSDRGLVREEQGHGGESADSNSSTGRSKLASSSGPGTKRASIQREAKHASPAWSRMEGQQRYRLLALMESVDWAQSLSQDETPVPVRVRPIRVINHLPSRQFTSQATASDAAWLTMQASAPPLIFQLLYTSLHSP